MIVPVNDQNMYDCVSVFLKAYNCPPWNYHWTHERAKEYLAEYVSCNKFVGFVLYDEDEPVGAVFARSKTWWTGQQLMIDEFFVSQEKQRRGYGKKLLDFCDKYAAEQQMESIILMTNKYMPSYAFYNKLDYTTTEQYVFMFKQVPCEADCI